VRVTRLQALSSLTKQVVQLVRRDTKVDLPNVRVLRSLANLTRKTCTKLYQNRPRFVKDMIFILILKNTPNTFWCVFRFTVLTAVYLQNANA